MSKKVDTTSYQKQGPSSSLVRTPQALGAFVVRAILAHPEHHVWWLRGPLGSGKTTSTRAVARRLGVRGVVSSPTYTLRRAYAIRHPVWRQLVHVDAYRVSRPNEYRGIGIDEDVADEKTLTLVEWPEHLTDLDWPAVGIFDISIVPGGRCITLRLPKAVAPRASSRRQQPSARRSKK